MKKYGFKTKLEDDNLFFSISGSIDTMNSPDLYADFIVIREHYGDISVIFDCEDLTYISSTGLRFFLKVHKKEKHGIKLINVSPNVYERFEMAGFVEFFEVVKGFQNVSNKDFKKIGSGGGIDIYCSDDLLLKVYSAETNLSDVELEREINHAILRHGIHTLISYDIVKYQGRYGLLYEKNTDAKTVAAEIKENPDKSDYYASAMGKLLKQIHTFTPDIKGLSNVADLNKTLVKGMEQWLEPAEIEGMMKLVNAIPEADTMLYYYFNPEHIFIYKGELSLINMANIRIGNPLFDFARAFRPYQRMPDFWKSMLYAYFKTGNIKKKLRTIEAASLLGASFAPASHKFFRGTDMPQDRIKNAVERARRDLFPNVKQIASLFAQYH